MTTSIIKILLIGDYSIFRNALRMMIETHKRLRVVGEADQLAAAADIIAVETPDLVLVDLPESRSRDILPHLHNIEPHVLVLIGEYDLGVYKQCLQFGISGLVLKEERAEVLFKAIEKIHEGELWFDRTMMGETIRQLIGETQSLKRPRPDPAAGLTDREREVINLLCAGMKTKDIGDSMFIAENTVRHHLTSVFNKLEINGRLELVIYAYRNGLVNLPNGNGATNGNGVEKWNGSSNGNGAKNKNGAAKVNVSDTGNGRRRDQPETINA